MEPRWRSSRYGVTAGRRSRAPVFRGCSWARQGGAHVRARWKLNSSARQRDCGLWLPRGPKRAERRASRYTSGRRRAVDTPDRRNGYLRARAPPWISTRPLQSRLAPSLRRRIIVADTARRDKLYGWIPRRGQPRSCQRSKVRRPPGSGPRLARLRVSPVGPAMPTVSPRRRARQARPWRDRCDVREAKEEHAHRATHPVGPTLSKLKFNHRPGCPHPSKGFSDAPHPIGARRTGQWAATADARHRRRRLRRRADLA